MWEVLGRGSELATLERFVDSSSLGALLLDGPAGIGKTTLWLEGVELARRRGRRVLTSRPASEETRLAFAGLSDLLAPVLDDVLPALPAPQRRALEVALLLRDPDGAPPDERAVLAAFASAVRVLAAQAPLLVAVDDVQWLDEPSASALAFAFARFAGDEPVGLLLARRSEGDEPLPLGLDRSPAERVLRVTVARLTRGALSQLLREQLDELLPRPTFLRVYEASEGNPFFALELARALIARGELRPPAGPLPVPATLGGLLRERIVALPETAAEPLLLLAAAGSAPPDVLGRALGEDPWERIRPAFEAGIVEQRGGQLGFVHPLLSSAVYDGADSERRRRAHLSLAAAADQLEEGARHLALAGTAPDPHTAQALEDAAEEAARRGAGQTVAELLDRAVAFTPPDDRPALVRRLSAAAAALNGVGDIGRARTFANQAVSLAAPGPERADALLALADAGYRDVESCEAALVEAGADHHLRARAQLTAAVGGHVHNAPRALTAARGAAADARSSGDLVLEARALAWVGRLEAMMNEGDPSATLSRAAALQEAEAYPPVGYAAEFSVAVVHLWRDEFALARDAFLRELRRAEELGDLVDRTDIQIYLGRLEFAAGNWDSAAMYFQEAAESWTAAGVGEYGNALVWSLALVPAHRGELETARAVVESTPAPAPDPSHRARNHWILGLVALCEGNAAEAVANLDAAAAQFAEMGGTDPGLRVFASDLIEARIAAGRIADARSEAEALLAHGRELDRPRALAIGLRGLGLAAAAEGKLDEALAALVEAAAEHTRLPVPFERARTLLALGSVQRRLLQRADARETLRQAFVIFEELGAAHWAKQASAELGRVGGRAPGDLLTTTERRVAELAATGSSNKEIAAGLVVTVKTVEATLSRVYRKLGVRSRAGLGGALAEQTVGESPLSAGSSRT